jgi:hypothetical protein
LAERVRHHQAGVDENPLGCGERAKQAPRRRSATSISIGRQQLRLETGACTALEVPLDAIVLGNGSNDLLDIWPWRF